MNPPRVRAEDYIDFLGATPKAASGTQAARVQPSKPRAPAHGAFTRPPHRLEPGPEDLWRGSRTQVDLLGGALVLDDSVLDQPHARHIELVGRHWSGKHHQVVQRIGLVTLLRTDADRHVPRGYRTTSGWLSGQFPDYLSYTFPVTLPHESRKRMRRKPCPIRRLRFRLSWAKWDSPSECV